jgi:putative FmdB family regulatory protein
MPIYVFGCRQCGARVEVFVRRVDDPTDVTCSGCGAAEMERVPAWFASPRAELAIVQELDPTYYKRVDAALANTADADAMRHLAKMIPMSAADSPGDPIEF